jgi:hypothetical protein
MSRINFITGELHGKLGEIVGSSWKGAAYTKAYKKPANPNTSAQIETRALFQRIAHIGKGVRVPLEQYTRPIPKHMTGYNRLIQLNRTMFNRQGSKWDPLELVIMSGELTTVPITAATIDGTALTAVVTWDGTRGEATDKALVVVYDDESGRTAYATEIDRSVGTATIDIDKFANISSYNNVYAYLMFYRDDGNGKGENSETSVLKMVKS